MYSEKSTTIRKWNDHLTRRHRVCLSLTDDPRSDEFRSFRDAFSRNAPAIEWEERSHTGQAPAIMIRDSWVFHAIPTGTELEPFMGLLGLLDQGEDNRFEKMTESLKKLPGPRAMKIYVTTLCPYCPKALTQILPLPLLNPKIRITVIDGQLFPEMAEKDDVQSAPTLIFDRAIRLTGQIESKQVVDILLEQGQGDLSFEVVERMILEGNAGSLAALMKEGGRIQPAFLDALVHPRLPVRLGAMVVMEEMMANGPHLAEQALCSVWSRLEGLEDSVKGDMIYLAGEMGDGAWTKSLKSLMTQGKSKEVREAAEEAWAKLKKG